MRLVDSRLANLVERDPGEPVGSRANFRVGPAAGPRVVCTVHGSDTWTPGERPQPDPWKVDCRATMHQLLGAMIRYNLDHDTQLTEFPWDELVAKGYLKSLPGHVNTGPNSQWMYYWSPAFGGTVSCRDACAVVSMELGVVRAPLPPIPPPPPLLRRDPQDEPGSREGFLGR